MAGKHFTKHAEKAAEKAEALGDAAIYKLRRDALMIVSNMNRGGQVVNSETMKRQLVFVQGQLCTAACADPKVTSQLKEALIAFHCATISENIADRRGARRRNRVNAGHGAW